MAEADTQERPKLREPRDNAATVRKIFENPKIVSKLKAAVPRHLNPERMLRVMSLAVQKVPKLLECDVMTLLGGMQVLASLGLEPNTPLGHAYLIPFDKNEKRGNQWVTVGTELNVIIGYKGYIDLARRTGMLVSLHADVVYGPAGDEPGDVFSFEYGSNMHLKHQPIGDNIGRPPLWAYAHASLKDGQAFEVLPYARVLRIRDNAEGYKAAIRSKTRYGDRTPAYVRAPWVAFEHEMSSKSMIRRLSKYLQMSIEFANAVELDAMSESGSLDLSAFADGVDLAVADVSEARVAGADDYGSDESRQIEHSRERPMDATEQTIVDKPEERETVTVGSQREQQQSQTKQEAPQQQAPQDRQESPTQQQRSQAPKGKIQFEM